MNAKSIVFIVFIGLISVFLWGISLYNGWFKEIFLFGYNIYSGFFDENIPSISANENVTTVRYGKFAYRLLTEIEIPDNITIIEKNAFKGNKLTNVTIGSNVTLGKNAIGNGFENFYYGNGKHAGLYTRTDHKSTEWIMWHDNFRYLVNNGNVVITDYRGPEDSVVIPAEIQGNPVTSIGVNAFRNKNLSSVTLPNSVDEIGVNAFAGNRITRISIGANVRLGDVGSDGILGEGTGFNTAYANNNNRAGIYTRPDANSTRWTRIPR
jgi:hypothetical protein